MDILAAVGFVFAGIVITLVALLFLLAALGGRAKAVQQLPSEWDAFKRRQETLDQMHEYVRYNQR